MAFETSSPRGSVAFLDNEKALSDEIFLSERSHSEQLLPTVDSLLKKNNISLSDIDFFAVTVGPGSFTGIRIGLATIKAFALVHRKKVVGLSTLEVLAQVGSSYGRLICPILYAGRGDVYAAIYKDGTELISPSLFSPSDLVSTIFGLQQAQNLKAKAKLFGDDVSLAHDVFKSNSDLFECVSPELKASAVGRLAIEKFKMAKDPSDLLPIYIRLPAAQEKINRTNK